MRRIRAKKTVLPAREQLAIIYNILPEFENAWSVAYTRRYVMARVVSFVAQCDLATEGAEGKAVPTLPVGC